MFVYEGNSHEIEKLLVLMLTMACVSAAFCLYLYFVYSRKHLFLAPVSLNCSPMKGAVGLMFIKLCQCQCQCQCLSLAVLCNCSSYTTLSFLNGDNKAIT